MTRSTITPDQATEVAQRIEEYKDATAKVAMAVGRYIETPTAPKIAATEHQRAGEALRRIREIYGDEAHQIKSAGGFSIK